MADALRLAMMTFPQHWDGVSRLSLNVLLLPSADPLNESLVGSDPATPAFARGSPTLRVVVNEGLAALPSTATGLSLTPTVISPAPNALATFQLLASSVTDAGATIGQPETPPPVTSRIRKALPPSYLEAGGNPPDGNLTTTDDDFGCAIREAPWGPAPSAGPPTVGWGEIISYALRQPVLATRLGLRYELLVDLAPAHADAFAQGGFVFVTLADDDPWAVAAAAPTGAGAIRCHAARVPPLDVLPRPVFAAVQFVVDRPATQPTDDAVAAAETYADGFAKLVHTTQPSNAEATVDDGSLAPGSDLGIQVGWDDEQVVTWQNDQLALLAARLANTLADAPETPLGVLGYRVDVADITPSVPGGATASPSWDSLVRVTADLPEPLGSFTGELSVEPAPTRPRATSADDAWLPRYFANWRGGSLCEPDATPRALTGRQAPPDPTRSAAGLSTLLSYGRTYAFRVRLADLSSGGPSPTGDEPIDPPPNATATQTFSRLVPPKAPIIAQEPPPDQNEGMPTSLVIRRPMVAYPEVLFTRLGDSEAARQEIRDHLVNHATSNAAGTAGLPDPDVDAVEIEVAVRHPLHDVGAERGVFQTLYVTSRPLMTTSGTPPLINDPGTKIDLAYVEAPSVLDWPPPGAGSGVLPIPRGRDVRVIVRAKLRAAEPGYFGSQAAAALATTIAVRCEPANEPPLLQRADATQPIRGFLFRRPPDVAAPPLVSQLAEELGVGVNGDSLTSPPGRRVVFAASRALHNTVSADGETLTFGGSDELLRNWVVAIVLDLERDWTWDGLEPAGFTVLRGGPSDTEQTAQAVGAIPIPRVLGAAATTHPDKLGRGRTRLVFLDAIDPHEPVAAGFPQSLSHRWFVKPQRTQAGPASPTSATPTAKGGTEYADAPLDLRLPIAIPPAQVPEIASVGIAMTPYVAGPGYASTEQRQRAIWVELAEPIANEIGDALFARVLAHGADPLLYEALPQVVEDTNPALPLDPELVRVIVPGDTDDRAGETAMTRLVPAQSSRQHFLLPLPPGVAADDPELFGFYSYEFRVGHSGPAGDLRWWSTANARFGAPLRVVGVQHPPPPLTCHAGRYRHEQGKTSLILRALRRSEASPFRVDPVAATAIGKRFIAEHRSPIEVAEDPPSLIVATAPYATPVLNGVPLVQPEDPPRTQLWFFVYAQAVQADGASMRNILLLTSPGQFLSRRQAIAAGGELAALFESFIASEALRDRIGLALFHQAELEALLAEIHLPGSAPLSLLAVELLPAGTVDELHPEPEVELHAATTSGSRDGTFPFGRILRTSPLTPIEPYC